MKNAEIAATAVQNLILAHLNKAALKPRMPNDAANQELDTRDLQAREQGIEMAKANLARAFAVLERRAEPANQAD